MATRWERRDERAVRPPKRISAKLLELAQPIIQQKLGRAGGLKRAACLPAKQRSRIARAAALSRWQRHRAGKGGCPFGRIIGMNEDAPPLDWYFNYAARMALQGGDASLRPDPDEV
jgi:hypothetical protein